MPELPNSTTLVKILVINSLYLTGKVKEVMSMFQSGIQTCKAKGYENIEIQKIGNDYWFLGSKKLPQ